LSSNNTIDCLNEPILPEGEIKADDDADGGDDRNGDIDMMCC